MRSLAPEHDADPTPVMTEPDGVRLVVAAHNFPPKVGGVERLADGLARHAWPATTTVIAEPAAGDRAHDAEAPYGVRRVPLVGRRFARWRPARRALGAALPDADAILCVEWWPHARALATLPRHGEVRAVLLCGTEVHNALRDDRTRAVLERALAACDVVLAISDFTAGLVRPLGVEPVILHPGVELDPPGRDPADVRRALDLGDARVVLTAARLVARKGHRDLLAAWPAIRSAHPDVVWLVAGDGPEREALEQTATPGVRFLGAVDDETLHGLYRLADVHVLPGREVDGHVEGFGMAAVEAAAAGTPTVATALGGTPEAVGPGGVIVEPGQPDQLAEAICALMVDDDHRRRLAAAARAHAEAHSWPVIAGQFRHVIEEALARR